jgi:hypothetical protein
MFSLLGLPLNDETYAFKKMYNISQYKNYFQNVSSMTNLNTLNYFKLYNNLPETNQTYTYKLARDHMMLNTMASKPLTLTYLDFKSLKNIYFNLISDTVLLPKLGTNSPESFNITTEYRENSFNKLGNLTFNPKYLMNNSSKSAFSLRLLDDALSTRSKTNFSLLENNPNTTKFKIPLDLTSYYTNKKSITTLLDNELLQKTSLTLFDSKPLKFSESNPVKSNNSLFDVKLFDSFYKSPIEQQSYLFNGKDEFIPNAYKNSTNTSTFNTLSSNVRVFQVSNLINLLSTQTFGLPDFFIDNSIKK